MRISFYASLAVFLSLCAARPSTLDMFSRSVVFLSDNVPIIERVGETDFEVWLKFPNTNAFMPKTIPVTGSGFVVVSSNIAYLITAKHVATRMTPACQVVMQGDRQEPLRFQLSSITGQPAIRWLHHTNADISIHPLPTVTTQGMVALSRRALPLEVLEAERNLPSRDIEVTVLGFPLGLGAQGQFIPISRASNVASGMLNDANGFFFLLQDPSVSGYSGGPLVQLGGPRFVATGSQPSSFAMVTGGIRCWGFVSGTFSDNTGGKMSRITPSCYAVELVRKAQRELRIWPASLPNAGPP